MNASPRRASPIHKRSIACAGHKTSVSLEEEFWRALKALAAYDGRSVNALIADVDGRRQDANLSSALRLYVLRQASAFPQRFQDALAYAGGTQREAA